MKSVRPAPLELRKVQDPPKMLRRYVAEEMRKSVSGVAATYRTQGEYC